MLNAKIIDDPDEFQYFWNRYWPAECALDCWGFRECFAGAFNRKSIFIVTENGRRITGILPLSWIDETACYSFFPGETWQGKTWIEQNRICAADTRSYNMLLENIPGAFCARYLHPSMKAMHNAALFPDEYNYACFPGEFSYSFDKYMQLFSGKSRKRLNRELARFNRYGVSFRHNCFSDLEIMFALNKNRYGTYSFFHDERFLKSLTSLAEWLRKNEMLRITSVLIGGKVAAVDIGAIMNGTYTLLAGGTHPEFPSVAKLINFHHLKWACAEKINCVDFMCGDFGWKERFHLTARPFYKFTLPKPEHRLQPELSCEWSNTAYVL